MGGSHQTSGHEMFQAFKDGLEALLPSEWFKKHGNSEHPLVRRWALCNKVLGGQAPEESDLRLLANMTLDTAVFALITQGNPAMMMLGSLDVYGDKQVQRKVSSRLGTKQFDDLMLELSFAAWHIMREHEVLPFEEDGPDFAVKVEDAPLPVYVECKRLHAFERKRIGATLTAANRQLRKAPEQSYRVAVLDVTETVPGGRVLSSDMPPEVRDIHHMIRGMLFEHFHSIGAVVLLWDGYQTRCFPPHLRQLTMWRGGVTLRHPNAHIPIPSPVTIFTGYTGLIQYSIVDGRIWFADATHLQDPPVG